MAYFNEEDYAQHYQSLELKVNHLREWIWGKNVSDIQIQEWLNNFSGKFAGDNEREKLSSLHLLSQYMFFDQTEIRAMLRSLYRDLFYKPLIQEIKKSGLSTLEEIQTEYNSCLSRTRFSGIGNSSESSCLLLYFFRQEFEFSKELFIDTCSIYNFDSRGNNIGLKRTQDGQDIEHYIFIDDLAASGDQAYGFFTNSIQYHLIKEKNPNARIYYFTLFNTPESRELFKNGLPDIEFRTVFELDDTYKVYSEESRYFPPIKNDNEFLHTEEKNFVHSMCKYYSNNALECGYGDSQLLLSFFYNTPDNTIETIWNDVNWNPVFKRYQKHY